MNQIQSSRRQVLPRQLLLTLAGLMLTGFGLAIALPGGPGEVEIIGDPPESLAIESDSWWQESEATIEFTLTLDITPDFEETRRLDLLTDAKFPIYVLGLELAFVAEDTYFDEVDLGAGALVPPGGLTLLRNIEPYPYGNTPRIQVIVTLEAVLYCVDSASAPCSRHDAGVLAPAGGFDVWFALRENENPITLDFDDFFQHILNPLDPED